MLIVSHDRAFVANVATDICVVRTMLLLVLLLVVLLVLVLLMLLILLVLMDRHLQWENCRLKFHAQDFATFEIAQEQQAIKEASQIHKLTVQKEHHKKALYKDPCC